MIRKWNTITYPHNICFFDSAFLLSLYCCSGNERVAFANAAGDLKPSSGVHWCAPNWHTQQWTNVQRSSIRPPLSTLAPALRSVLNSPIDTHAVEVHWNCLLDACLLIAKHFKSSSKYYQFQLDHQDHSEGVAEESTVCVRWPHCYVRNCLP